jgi:nucleoside phosphorylase
MIALVAPTRREAGALGARAVGAGERCVEGLARLLDEQRPEVLLIVGVCGGLDPSLSPGELILARRVITAERDDLAPDPSLLEAARKALRVGGYTFSSSTLLTVDQLVGTKREKIDVWNQYGAAGVDMETYRLAEIALARGVRWLALRAVIDAAAASLPPSLLHWREESDEQEFLRKLVRRPSDWLAAGGLALHMRTALRALRRALPALVEVPSLAQTTASDP